MRRLSTPVCILFVALFLPARADANIWHWIDDLSGPRFWGVQVDWHVWCWSEDVRTNINVLRTLAGSLDAAVKKYEAAENKASGLAQAYYRLAKEAATNAQKDLDEAIRKLNESEEGVSDLVSRSLRWREFAASLSETAEKSAVVSAALQQPPTALRLPPEPNDQATTSAKSRAFGGVAVSICPARPFERPTAYLSLNLSGGWDTKEENALDHNKMVTFGGSYHRVFTPYLTVGAGFGNAWFTSTTSDGFQKFYIQPWIVDVKPFAFRRNSELLGPWWHVLFVRYSTVTFPAGFEAGRFGGRSDAFPAELVHSWAVMADLDPLARKLRAKW